MLRKIFYLAIKGFAFLFYPLIWVYNRFLVSAFDEVVGKYWKSQISNKGVDLRIHGKVKIIAPHKLSIGDYCRIGKGCFLFCYGGLKIGNNVQMSRNITIYTANHDFNSDILPYNDKYIIKPVIIEDNVWIGMNASILPGVIISKNSIIGMNAVVSKDVPANAIVVGNNRIIRYRTEEQIKLSEGRYFGELFPNN